MSEPTSKSKRSVQDERLSRARASLFLSIFRPMGHALNNPLQGALGAVELAALSGAAIEAARGESMGNARDEILRAAGLVSALQGLARGVDEGAATWAASFDRCATLAHALSRHGGFSIDSAAADLSPQVQAPAAAMDLVWLGIVDAHLRLGLPRGSQVVVTSRRETGALCLQGDHFGGTISLDDELASVIRDLSFDLRAEAGSWSLRVGLAGAR